MRINKIKVRNIFAAVSDKSILDLLLQVLDRKSVRFWGTEGTTKYLKSKGFKTESIVSGFDFDGRVKSLERKNFARILVDRTKRSHVAQLKSFRLESYDLVVVDLYPSYKKSFPESMDVGGQALIRAAVKNYKNVAVAFDRRSLASLVNELVRSSGSTSLSFRKKQAQGALKFIAKRCGLEAKYFK